MLRSDGGASACSRQNRSGTLGKQWDTGSKETTAKLENMRTALKVPTPPTSIRKRLINDYVRVGIADHRAWRSARIHGIEICIVFGKPVTGTVIGIGARCCRTGGIGIEYVTSSKSGGTDITAAKALNSSSLGYVLRCSSSGNVSGSSYAPSLR